ncbi:MAG: 23S rRNA (pseudouridine(1915)-N(3))-methyltransferase RlmH, partial [Clostridia bacterium]|nr:23S rRNA (pseudouridine(1915)-N(3))-methyltransferase RlmH [Clostridia bacterium]
MRICIICVGKLGEKWQKLACDEYLKRLGRFARIEMVELPDEPESDKPSPAMEKRAVDREAARILSAIKPADLVVGLFIDADAPDSIALSKKLAAWRDSSRRVVFVIGG